ncbi:MULTISPECIES: replication initiator protein A [Staphylococcus]|uniref:replication initiator protein A n=1 Tax=Staphylococcus TaxID=1279 RepID=UPI001952B37A|nr:MULTISPECIES: replication initiator protein A [Staphylococcus]MCT2553860.1 replication initiator protein A [Staphylococcus aureus]MCT2569006.1 replication initiator protein A [Staphylococcus aureus]MCT2572844.1 replication initiator protein A [Staphylococcus aureus]MCT2575575.1 replication initiator protein A [Staphylococcus aureus]MEA1207906.1 replication initiator protein A [Staphylococcus aureus]
MPRKNIKNQASQNFYMLHKALFVNEKYKKLSDSAKVAYAILNDRVSLSIKNNWIDDNGDIYFIFTNENLQKVLGKSKNTITKIKKELQEVGLLEQVRVGFNQPNKLYLHEIETNISVEKEIQNASLNEQKNSDDADSHFLGVRSPKKWESRVQKNGSPESQKLDPNYTDINYTDINYTDINDMNDMRDNNIKSNKKNTHTNHTNHDSLNFDEEALKFTELQEFPEQSKQYLNNFSYRELKIVKEIILKAKKSFNTEHNTTYMLEDIDYDLVNVLKRFKSKVYIKNESIERMQGYLMKCIKMELEELHSLNMRKKNFKNSSWSIFSQID